VVEAAFPRSSESETLAHGVAMHIAASAPLWVTASDIPGAVLDARRAEFAAEAARAGKPAAIVERIVEGRVDKYIAQSTLMGQPYALNPDERVGDVLRDAGQGWRCTLAVRQYVRFQVGETEPAEV
jgi:elongation factor Ts